MSKRGELGARRVCCLLHNLIPGGSARQWIHLLGRHVEGGGSATILAPPGPLAETARAAGIEVVPVVWKEAGDAGWPDVIDVVSRHEVAIVHWDYEVMGALEPALEACGRVALVVHQAPRGLARWFEPKVLEEAKAQMDRALSERHAVILVRGNSHRRRFEREFGIPPDRLDVLPASIPMPPFAVAAIEPREMLALVRLSPEKEAIWHLAVELTAAALATDQPTRLTIAGDGPCRAEAEALCERSLPAGSWRIEGAPPDPVGRLAEAEVVVSQGLTTLEATALGRRVVVARMRDDRCGGTVLRPDRYDEAARDPFGEPALTSDAGRLWSETLAVDETELRALRQLVEAHNSLGTSSRALGDALAKTARRSRWRGPMRRG